MTETTWNPRYAITPAIARSPMEIEAARAEVDQKPLPLNAEAELRRRARLRSTHYSTRIEENRLTLAEAEGGHLWPGDPGTRAGRGRSAKLLGRALYYGSTVDNSYAIYLNQLMRRAGLLDPNQI